MKTKKSIFLLGCRAAGKTSFLSGLAILSRPGNKSDFALVSRDESTATHFTDLRDLADRQHWPAPTSTLTPLDFEIKFQDRLLSLGFLDYPGEDLLQAMETLDEENYQSIMDHIDLAEGLMVLLDPTQDLMCSLTHDVKEARRRQDALGQGIGKLFIDRREANTAPPIICLVVTKQDLLTANGISLDTIARDNEDLFQNFQKLTSATNVKTFAVSACGPCTAGKFPISPTPTGYNKLFSHLNGQFLNKENKKRNKLALTSTLAVLFIFVIAFFYHKDAQEKATQIILLGDREDVASLVNTSQLSDAQQAKLDERMKAELSQLQVKLSNSTTRADFEECRKDALEVKGVHNHPFEAQLDEMLEDIENKIESAIYDEFLAMLQLNEHSEAMRVGYDYRARFPNGSNIENIKKKMSEIEYQTREHYLTAIKQIRIDDRDSLGRKLQSIQEFLDKYPGDSRAKDIRIAMNLAQQLSSLDKVRIRIKRCGISGRKRDIAIHYNLSGVKKELFDTEKQDIPEDEVFNVDKHIDIHHREWSKLDVSVTDLDAIDELMKSEQFNLLLDLRHWNGDTKVELEQGGDPDFLDYEVWLKLRLECPHDGGWHPVPKNELDAYGKYIYPGGAWR